MGSTNRRANALAERLEAGARALVDLASKLTDAEWQTRLPRDGRRSASCPPSRRQRLSN